MATVLVIGASRGIGLETVKRALAAGHEVRALARSADAIAIDDPALTIIPASVLDEEPRDLAVRGTDAVITAIGVPPTLSPVRLFSQCARVVTESMQAHDVRRLIAVTGIGAGPTREVGGFFYTRVVRPVLLHTIYEDKDREEAIIRDSGLDWTIVRPGYLTRLAPRGHCRALTDPADWEGGFITRGDVADYLVRIIDDRETIHQTPLLID